VGARIPLGTSVALMPSIGYIAPLGGGDDLYDRFREPSLAAMDIALRFAFRVGKGFELRAGFEYERYGSSFSPVPGDAYVAGGALDQFIFIDLGAAYVF